MTTAMGTLDFQTLLFHNKPQQYPKSSIVANLDARGLNITWASDTRYWNLEDMKIGGLCMEVAELINVCWLEINGRYAVDELTGGMDYQVKFKVKLLNNFNIDKPVTFTVSTPHGRDQEHTENMMAMPRNEIISITAGEFQTPSYKGRRGEVRFSMKNTDGFW